MLQNCKGHQKQRKSKNLTVKSNQGDRMTECNVISWMTGAGKDIRLKPRKI